MLLLIFAHVDAGHHVLVVEKVFGECLGEFGFAHAGCSEEYEGSDRSPGVVKTGARTAHGVGYRANGLFLADYSLMEFFFKVEQLFFLALNHLVNRYACPA